MLTAVGNGDKLEINVNLKQYKFANGATNFDAILRIPFEDRLPGLIQKVGLKQVHMMLAKAITMAMESLNLSKPLTSNQIIDLVDTLIDTSSEDYLSFEDIMLFLQQMVRGGSGELFSSMDIAKFMNSFEKYRQKRHTEYKRLKEESHSQHSGTPFVPQVNSEMQRDSDIDGKTFLEMMQTFYEGKNEEP